MVGILIWRTLQDPQNVRGSLIKGPVVYPEQNQNVTNYAQPLVASDYSETGVLLTNINTLTEESILKITKDQR